MKSLPAWAGVLPVLFLAAACSTPVRRAVQLPADLPTVNAGFQLNNDLADAGMRVFHETAGCAQCHTVGGGRMAGPDLLGVVERRQLEWLHKFIQDAPGMITAADPIAVALYEEYHRTMMPDINISDQDVERVIHYLAAESQRVREKQGNLASN